MSQRSAKEIAKSAEGDIDPSELTETEGGGLSSSSVLLYDKPIIDYLQEDEELHYLYSNTESESFQVDIQGRPPRSEYASYKDVDGKRYFLITNKRILCVAGCSDGDKTTEIQYADVFTSTHKKLEDKTCIYVRKENHTQYEFVFGTSNHDLLSACEYISVQSSRKSADKTNSDDKDQVVTNKINYRESHICIFPDAPTEMSSIAHQETLTKTKTITDAKLIRDDQHTKIYEYENIQPIQLGDECIKLGKNRISISYENIVHIEFVSKEDTHSLPSNFVRLITNNFGKSLNYIYFVVGEDKIHTTGNNWSAKIKNKPDTDKNAHKKIAKEIKQKCTNIEPDIIILNDWVEKTGELRIEGLQKGNSRTGGTISGSTESEGVSKGVQVGPFSKSKSKSQGSIDGKIKSVTSDNTFSSDIEFVQIDKDGIYVEADPVIDVNYSEIDRVAKRDNGILLEIGQHTYSISGHGYPASKILETSQNTESFEKYDLKKIVSSIQDRMSEFSDKTQSIEKEDDANSGQTPAEKIKDLKELYDSGIISEEEFKSKKSALLDEF